MIPDPLVLARSGLAVPDYAIPVEGQGKGREGISGQSFNSGHGISWPSHSRL